MMLLAYFSSLSWRVYPSSNQVDGTTPLFRARNPGVIARLQQAGASLDSKVSLSSSEVVT
jgi:hypothetical protein